MADLYSILGTDKTADAATIKRAYRKLAKKYHPDHNKGDARAAERFKEATAAYDILSDTTRRGQYDRGEIDDQGNARAQGFGAGRASPHERPAGMHPQGFEFDGDVGDLFSELFGRGRRAGGVRPPPRKGADRSYRLSVPFVDAALARTVRLALRRGKSIDLRIPAGVEDGSRIRLSGQGEEGPAGAGDAIVQLLIEPDSRFVRDGNDLRTDILVPLATAVLGGRQKVATPDGDVILTIAAATSSGKVLRLKGKGWTGRDGGRGDLLARVLVDVPADPALADFLRSRHAGS